MEGRDAAGGLVRGIHVEGRRELVDAAARFDPPRWHDYLRETNAGGYRWSNKHLGMPKRIAEVIGDPAWCRAIEELRDNA